MFVKRRRGWELPDSAATPEATYLDRRKLLAGMGFGATATLFPAAWHAAPFPAPRNDR